jgi:hypothetical protein
VGAAGGLSGKYGPIAQKGADAGAAAGPQISQSERIRAMEWLRANPKDPRAAGVKAKLMGMR